MNTLNGEQLADATAAFLPFQHQQLLQIITPQQQQLQQHHLQQQLQQQQQQHQLQHLQPQHQQLQQQQQQQQHLYLQQLNTIEQPAASFANITKDALASDVKMHSAPANADSSLLNEGDKQIEINNKTSTAAPPAAATATGNNRGYVGAIKRKKIWKKKPKDVNAPKHPLTGYVRYMNDRREELRRTHAHLTGVEMTKKIGEEWMVLEEGRKKPYLEAAEVDKERYSRELQVYKLNNPDGLLLNDNLTNVSNNIDTTINAVSHNDNNNSSSENSNNNNNNNNNNTIHNNISNNNNYNNNQQNNNNNQQHINNTNNITSTISSIKYQSEFIKYATTNNSTADNNYINTDNVNYNNQFNNSNNNNSSNNHNHINNNQNEMISDMMVKRRPPGDYDVPIFTDEFLDHNKTVDSELRILRKSNIDFEQQNSVLEKHVENMKNGVDKLTSDNFDVDSKNQLLSGYLEKLQKKLATSLSGLSIPTEPNGANIENIDKYMSDLHQMSTSNSHGPASLNKAKDIIRKLDLQIPL